MLAPVKPYAAHFYRDGATLITFDCARFMPTVKSLNYITALMGQRKARAGAAEALYCDAGGLSPNARPAISSSSRATS
jgi:hypothetical protein